MEGQVTFFGGWSGSASLNRPDKAAFYTPGEEGYTDYPFPGGVKV